ncbi:TBC domain protein, putative [Plasmodium ovale wallikeri]|uniref:TBC domain protein, putative n=1 Tax=Plasmodium ovale wallikeri TaxID=864142 RepID=A0A1A8Z7W8_PLAOA|nr:TBC domain protein, putative [Plasmodium ovale wallikeri]SBT40339.1 TBC domain protein, putative [Plasmodium ovale wallikeri]
MKLGEQKNEGVEDNVEKKNISQRMKKLCAILNSPIIDINELRNILWGGIPDEMTFSVREKCWKLALGYLPLNREETEKVLKKKRDEYENLKKQYYKKNKMSEDELKILRQIKVDIPRTKSCYNIFCNRKIQELSEHVLFIYSVRHPACGYVQGINDMITPFLIVFLRPIILKKEITSEDIDNITDDKLKNVESDLYFCLSKLLEQIQDNYTFGQPVHWSKYLKEMDFQQMLLFMQRFPTQNWKIQDIESLLSEAFVLKNAFQSSPKHFS